MVLISCWKNLRDTGTVDRRPGSGRPCSARTHILSKTIAMPSYA